MKNLFAYDFTTNTIVASKATLKKAGNPTTPEYKALMKMIADDQHQERKDDLQGSDNRNDGELY